MRFLASFALFLFAGDAAADKTEAETCLRTKIWDGYTTKNLLASNGTPTVNWNGGGNNGIYYDHCWATNMMARVPFTPPPSTKPLKILSLRNLPY